MNLKVRIQVVIAFLVIVVGKYILLDSSTGRTTKSVSTKDEKPGQGQDQCPVAVRNAVGIFQEDSTGSSTTPSGFENVVLLTASNYAFLDFLQNWEFLALEHGLKWAVLSLDNDLYDYMNNNNDNSNDKKTREDQSSPSRVVPIASEFAVNGLQGTFRSKKYNKVVCNKIRHILHILDHCPTTDIVFSDSDNVFLQNPFRHELGKMIQSKQFDYIYQPNNKANHRAHPCFQNGGVIEAEANTGFYYLKSNNPFMRQVLQETLQQCDQKGNKLDDQWLLWRALHKLAFGETKYKSHNGTAEFPHCTAQQLDDIVDGTTTTVPSTTSTTTTTPPKARFCCMDAYYYPVAHDLPAHNPNPITFHANYCVGRKSKSFRLWNITTDHHGWNNDRIHLPWDWPCSPNKASLPRRIGCWAYRKVFG